mmetsp:Transcript_10229/g.29154  ORF Transcript_10229/g.29154 Transcript_10229/m.29154 type:complete len:217 (-) Transcript_10229:227-877(-)
MRERKFQRMSCNGDEVHAVVGWATGATDEHKRRLWQHLLHITFETREFRWRQSAKTRVRPSSCRGHWDAHGPRIQEARPADRRFQESSQCGKGADVLGLSQCRVGERSVFAPQIDRGAWTADRRVLDQFVQQPTATPRLSPPRYPSGGSRRHSSRLAHPVGGVPSAATGRSAATGANDIDIRDRHGRSGFHRYIPEARIDVDHFLRRPFRLCQGCW